MPSVARTTAFKNCASNNPKRTNYDLDKVSYADKMTDSQISRVIDWMKDEGISMSDLMTYKGMEKLSKVICRWPRPSEIAHVSRKLDKVDLLVWRLTARLNSDVNIASFIGPMGVNMTNMTKDNNLMYVWVDATSLHMYANTKKKLDDAIKAIKGDIESQTTVKYRVGDKAWSTPLNPTAKPFRPLNPKAKPFKPAQAS